MRVKKKLDKADKRILIDIEKLKSAMKIDDRCSVVLFWAYETLTKEGEIGRSFNYQIHTHDDEFIDYAIGKLQTHKEQ